MHLIYEELKAGNPPDMKRFGAVRRDLEAQGAQIILLGCTELSLIESPGPGVLDMLEVLARASIVQCGARLKPEFQNLIREGEGKNED